MFPDILTRREPVSEDVLRKLLEGWKNISEVPRVTGWTLSLNLESKEDELVTLAGSLTMTVHRGTESISVPAASQRVEIRNLHSMDPDGAPAAYAVTDLMGVFAVTIPLQGVVHDQGVSWVEYQAEFYVQATEETIKSNIVKSEWVEVAHAKGLEEMMKKVIIPS